MHFVKRSALVALASLQRMVFASVFRPDVNFHENDGHI